MSFLRLRKHFATFREAFGNTDDQVVIRDAVLSVLTDEQKQAILDMANADIDRHNAFVAQRIIEREKGDLT